MSSLSEIRRVLADRDYRFLWLADPLPEVFLTSRSGSAQADAPATPGSAAVLEGSMADGAEQPVSR